MTNHNNAAQLVLTDLELLEVGARYGRPSVALLPMWRAIESALLSKLRAPVAGGATVYLDAGHLREVLAGNDIPVSASAEPGHGMVPIHAAPLASDAVRAPDYTLQHADHMAVSAERLMEAINARDAIIMQREESDDVEDETMHEQHESVSEYLSGMRNAIYEYRKRRNRAALSAQPDAEPLSNPKQFPLTAADERTAFEATYKADYDDPGAACEREHFGKGYRAGMLAARHHDDAQEASDTEQKRFVILKESGSRFAYVNDTELGRTVKRFDVLNGDGWGKAERLATRLNAQHDSAGLAAQSAKEQGGSDA